ncbi:MAG: membrane protein insertase YidC [Firmicutes bacterium]|nr:membrane protein insertase YidC [Bacillota bacterium]
MESLAFFYSLTNDYGLSIILLTIAVRLITLPLSMKQIASTRAMQEIAPERKKLEEKYKDDKEKLNKATMELYKEKNINPLAGCLPLLVQFPVLISVFQVLRETELMAERIGEHFSPEFMGLLDLSQTDPYFIIPILAGLTTYVQTKQTSAQQPQQGGMGMMTMLMPFMIVAFSIGLPAGLPLYWLVGNLFSIGQHYIVAQVGAREGGGTGA